MASLPSQTISYSGYNYNFSPRKTATGVHIPPVFSRFARFPKDLLKKRFDFDHSLKVSTQSINGLKVQSTVLTNDLSDVRGSVKVTLPRLAFGLASAELYTEATQESKVTLEVAGLPKGLTITPSFASKDKQFKQPLAGVELSYQQEYVSAFVGAKSDLSTHKIDASLSVGEKGYSVGGAVALDVTNGPDVQEYNVGFEYEQTDCTYTCYTENQATTLANAFFQRLTPYHVLGAIFRVSLQDRQQRSLAIASEYRVSQDTTVKAKIEVPSGELATHVETRYSNPNLLVGIASAFSLGANKIGVNKVGVSLALGDI